jgi:hypothetical protein
MEERHSLNWSHNLNEWKTTVNSNCCCQCCLPTACKKENWYSQSTPYFGIENCDDLLWSHNELYTTRNTSSHVQIVSFASTKDTMRRECNRSECALGPSHMVEQNTSMGQCSIWHWHECLAACYAVMKGLHPKRACTCHWALLGGMWAEEFSHFFWISAEKFWQLLTHVHVALHNPASHSVCGAGTGWVSLQGVLLLRLHDMLTPKTKQNAITRTLIITGCQHETMLRKDVARKLE